MSDWMKSLSNQGRPVITMAQVPALPGTPKYDDSGEGIAAASSGPRPRRLCQAQGTL